MSESEDDHGDWQDDGADGVDTQQAAEESESGSDGSVSDASADDASSADAADDDEEQNAESADTEQTYEDDDSEEDIGAAAAAAPSDDSESDGLSTSDRMHLHSARRKCRCAVLLRLVATRVHDISRSLALLPVCCLFLCAVPRTLLRRSPQLLLPLLPLPST